MATVQRMEKMGPESRYEGMRVLGIILQVLGWIVVAAAVVSFFVSLFTPGLAILARFGFALASLIGLAFAGLIYIALGQGVFVLLDIEHNTRMVAEKETQMRRAA